MRKPTTTLRAALGGLAFASALFSSSAQASAACSHDRLVVDGQVITTTLCAGESSVAAGTQRLPLQAHFTGAKGSLDQSFVLRFPALTPTPRAVEDIDLSSLGIPKTLHISVHPHNGSVEIDHALLLPGPTVIR